MGQGGDMMSFMLMMVLVFGVFFFLVIRPERKKQKALEEQRNNLKAGDEVVTNGGIYGKVSGIESEKNVVKLKVDSGTTLRVTKESIATVLTEKVN